MFVLVPLGSDQSVRRYPWFTIAVIAICFIVQIREQIVTPPEAVRDAASEQLLSTLQQVVTVTISSAVNLLITGLLLIGFVILAPNGLVGLWHHWTARRSKS